MPAKALADRQILRASRRPGPRPWRFLPFLGVWTLTVLAGLSLAYGIGVAPTALAEVGDAVTAFFIDGAEPAPVARSGNAAAVVSPVADEAHIIIPSIGVDSRILEPEKTDISILNDALLRGVVRYPGSARPNEVGNVFLFGHSTGLSVVHNKNFEVFNRLSELSAGDMIRIRYGDREYWYQVTSLSTKKAADALVDLAPSGRKLTLSTCRVFGAKDDRYVVEADFVKSYPLRSAR